VAKAAIDSKSCILPASSTKPWSGVSEPAERDSSSKEVIITDITEVNIEPAVLPIHGCEPVIRGHKCNKEQRIVRTRSGGLRLTARVQREEQNLPRGNQAHSDFRERAAGNPSLRRLIKCLSYSAHLFLRAAFS
jgi:hypothetical protein